MSDTQESIQAGLVWTRRGFMGALGVLAVGSGGGWADYGSPALSTWRDNFNGRSVARGEPDYEAWRTAMPWQMYTAPRQPELIARPDSAAAVSDVLAYARKQGLRLAIKSGGHNVSEAFLRDGGVLLDLGELQSISVDPESATAWVEPSLWSYGFLQALEPHGLAFPVAHCATVPMGGYLLGGGVGYNHDNWGSMACQSILAAEVVLASGETVIASPDSNPDLYWAVRGSGIGFFGVVTRYKLQLYQAPDAVYESSYIFPLSRLADATALLQAWVGASPKNTELMMLLAHNPMAVAGSSPLESKLCVVRAVSYGESPAQAKGELAALGEHPLTAGAVVSNAIKPTSLQGMAVSSVDASMGLGFGRYAVDTVWTDKLPEVMAAIADNFAKASSVKTHFVVSPKLNRELPDNAAFSMIGNTFVGAYTMWDEPAGDAANFSWLAGASALMRPLAVGQYINEVDAFRDPAAPQRCFSAQAWKRLAALRHHYDPRGLFYSWPGCP